MVDNIKMPVSNETTMERTYSDPCAGFQAHEERGFFPVCCQLRALSGVRPDILWVCAVPSACLGDLSFTPSLVLLMVFNFFTFEIDIIWVLIIPTLWEGILRRWAPPISHINTCLRA